jgi:ribosome-binding protein aMBF1 (putative translation factor)
MAKYSTGDSGSSSGGSCELCGATDVSLQSVNIAGAQLDVCAECARHRDDAAPAASGSADSDGSTHDTDRKRRAAQNAAKMHDAAAGDADHWENGAGYDDDQLPYLVSDYDRRVVDARQGAGLQRSELATELGVDEAALLAVEQGRANQAGVGGSLIAAIEDRLDVSLSDA